MSTSSKNLPLTLIASILFAIAFLPLGTGFLAYFTIVPLFFLLEKVTLTDAIFYGYLFGFLSNIFSLFWIANATLPGMVGAVLILALYNIIFFVLYWLIRRKSLTWAVVGSPFLWVAVEWIRSHGTLGFPWLNLSHTQASYPVIIQFAEFTGEMGISFWLVLVNIGFYLLLKWKFKRKSIVILASLILLFAVPIAWGIHRLHKNPPEDTGFRVALLQGNVDPYLKWTKSFQKENFRLYYSMIQEAAEKKADFIILPETATASYLTHTRYELREYRQLVDSIGIPVLFGSLDFRDTDRRRYYNAAFLMHPTRRTLDRYYKIQLVPFSEKTPLADSFPFLYDIDFGQGNFSSGKEKTIFRVDGYRFATLICFEAMFPELVRKFVVKKIDFIVNITNDGWFGNTPGPYQHLFACLLRAVETRRPIVRCANTGVSAVIDPMGRITSHTKYNEKTILFANVPQKLKTTFYTRYGDITGKLSLSITGALSIIFLILARV